jgi:hypothetical protein
VTAALNFVMTVLVPVTVVHITDGYSGLNHLSQIVFII